MCVRPIQKRNKYGEIVVTAQCRKCEQCVKARKRSYTGKILAEMTTAYRTFFVTLTYAGGYDNVKAYVINYKHFQNYLKKLRNAGYNPRYLAVGEFGGDKGRAHFHAMLFFQDSNIPDWKLDERIECEFWEHGKVQYELPRSKQGSAAYIMDYLDKDNLAKSQLKFSTRPMLGETYLLDMARKAAVAGVAIFQDGNRYTIPGNAREDGSLYWYPLERERRAYGDVIMMFISTWIKHRFNEPLPMNEEIEMFMDEIENNKQHWPAHMRAYMEKHYGIIQCTEWDKETETYRELPHIRTVVGLGENLIAEVSLSRVTLQALNSKGELEWHFDYYDVFADQVLEGAVGQVDGITQNYTRLEISERLLNELRNQAHRLYRQHKQKQRKLGTLADRPRLTGEWARLPS